MLLLTVLMRVVCKLVFNLTVSLVNARAVAVKDRPKPVYTFSAENETGAENVILFSAETEAKTKLVNHFRPITKPKTKVIILIDYSVILHQHQQWFLL